MVDGRGSEIGDGEVEEPLSCGGETNTVGSETRGKNFGYVDPWDGAPGCGVSDDEEINHYDHGDGCWWD